MKEEEENNNKINEEDNNKVNEEDNNKVNEEEFTTYKNNINFLLIKHDYRNSFILLLFILAKLNEEQKKELINYFIKDL